MSEPWIKKYVPKSSAGIKGQDAALSLMASLLQKWSRKSKPLFLWGETGIGKTAAALAFAKELDLELIEVNASDSRNKEAIHTIVGGAVKQGSLFGTSKLILIDEVDGLSGVKDRGALPELMDIIKGSSFPIVITGLDPFDSKFSSLRKMCELIEFKPVPYKVIAEHVQEVLQKEGRTFAVDAVLKIAMGAGGDMRAAINDAQSLSSSGSLTMHDVALLGDRDKTETMQHALLRVFKAKSAEVAKGAFDNVDEDIDKILLWVDHNLPTEYKQPLDRKRAFDALADADIFLGRIRRWQHYRFYVYAYDFLSVGVAVAKDERYPGVSTYVQSDRILKIWLSKQKFMKKQAIAEKMALRMHGSIKRSFADVSFVQQMFLHNKQMAESLSGYFDLDKEEVAWLKK